MKSISFYKSAETLRLLWMFEKEYKSYNRIEFEKRVKVHSNFQKRIVENNSPIYQKICGI